MAHNTAVASQVPGGQRRERRDIIDFWRGLVLCVIFINHIPGNAFEFLTQKNFGFSDSAEAFVFLSGLSLALAYGQRFKRGDASAVILTLGRRTVKLYGVHVFLSFAAIAIFAAGAVLGDKSGLLEVHGRDLFIDDPRAALIGLLSLGHQLGYFNILPLYMVLIAMLPLLFWVSRAGVWPMLAASLCLYLGSRLWGWNIPTWPMKGTWFFDPFAWQFLMAIGVAVGLAPTRPAASNAVSPLILAIGVVAFGAFSVTDGLSYLPGLQDWTRGWADIDKTTLGAGRIIHFVALAYLLYRFGERIRRSSIFQPLCVMGRNSLWIFGLLSLLAAFGQVLSEIFGHTVLLDTAMILGGLTCLYGTAVLLETRRAIAVPQVAT